ncbi:MAG: nucleoside hydrolase [Angelakisella sp.]
MTKIPVMIDCDTGIDDAAALILAFASNELEICGVTTVAGNVELSKTTPNTLKVLDLIGAQVPVYVGADKPLFRELHTAAEVHGKDGLQGIELPESKRTTEKEAAWDAIHREAVRLGGKLQLIAVGPLTNIAIALSKYNNLPQLIERIVIMGGAVGCGNTTPAAEFNIYVDPEAAEMVFRSGIPVYACGLDVTHKSTLNGAEIEKIRAVGTPVHRFFAEVCQHSLNHSLKFYGQDGAHLHDPCALMYALDSSYFTTKRCWVGVETKGTITRGRTVTDLYSDAKHEPNAWFVVDIEREKFVERIMAMLNVD